MNGAAASRPSNSSSRTDQWRSLHCNSNSSSRPAARRRARSCNSNDGGVHLEQPYQSMAELAPVGLIVRKAVAAGWRRSPCAGLHAWRGEGACASEMTSSRRATVTASSRGRDSLQSNSHGELPRERRPRGKGEHYNVQRYNTHGNVEEYSVLQLRATDRSTPIRRRLSEEGGGKGEHYNVQRYNTHGNVEEYSVLQLRATDRSTPIRRRLSEEGGGLIRAPSTPAERSARACSTPRMRARRGAS